MTRTPIAIIGRACVLPGANSPEALWQHIVEGRDLVGRAPADRWGVGPEHILCAAGEPAADRTWSDRGGYVENFDAVFDPGGFALPAHDIQALDPVFQWVLHTARQALRDAGHDAGNERVGAVFGNLSFPSAGMSRFAESLWRDDPALAPPPDPRNRFSSGLPALLLEDALRLGAGAFALDAACASSLYAIKTACDWLRDGRADLMLAGAVNCADDLFIHVGFSALAALSKSGRSRPFHAAADGLVPAEGAGFVALKRLADAERDGDRILGVIRGVGLSNDGRGRGFLVPAQEGQVRALRAAYADSGLSPADISLLECHATGTSVGDATELESLREVFGERAAPVPIGSLKSNLGHLITAAGVAGLIKVLEAMRTGLRPPTLHVDQPNPALAGSPFRLLTAAEPWTVEGPAPRRAGISAFGFGGNNAHLIVEEYRPGTPAAVAAREAASAPPAAVAIVGIGAILADCDDRAAWVRALQAGGRAGAGRIDSFEIDAAALGIPPADLQQTLPQQLLMLEAGRQAAAEVGALPRERSSVFVGMGVDPTIARYGARWRAAAWADALPAEQAADWLGQARAGLIEVLQSAGVIGTMPNMPANRLNRQLDLGGPSCSVCAEERSGLEALDLAVRALRHGELDAALVGAVDLSCDAVHAAAAEACLPAQRRTPGDAAVALVLKRLDDAERDGDRIYAVLDHAGAAGALAWPTAGAPLSMAARWGHAHAASGLLDLAAAALSLHHRLLPDGRPWLAAAPRRASVAPPAMAGAAAAPAVVMREGPADADARHCSPYRMACYEGADGAAVLAALEADAALPRPTPGHEGARLVLVADSAQQLAQRRARAAMHLRDGAPPGEGVHFRARPVPGELGFVFASAGSTYFGMGRDLLHAMPQLGDRLGARFSGLDAALGWVYEDPAQYVANNSQRLWASSALCQLHAELTLRVLGLRPSAAIGYCSGESNSLFAFGAWRDLDAMHEDIARSGLYERELAGDFAAVARAWGLPAGAPVEWAVWSVLHPLERVRACVAGEERVHLTIIHTAANCVIAGDAAACRRVVEALGPNQCRPLDYNMAAHVPEVDEFREPWLNIHRRAVGDCGDVRFYSGGCEHAYRPERETCAQVIAQQNRSTLDFPRLIEQAWADGVRIFVEHGPQGACSSWIREILGARLEQAVVVPLDRRSRGFDAIVDAAGALLAAGVAFDPGPLLRASAPASAATADGRGGRKPLLLSLPAHRSPVTLPPRPAARRPALASNGVCMMEPAPRLPSVFDEHLLPDFSGAEPHAERIPAPVSAPAAAAPAPTGRPGTADAAPPLVSAGPAAHAAPATIALAAAVAAAPDAANAAWQARFEHLTQVHRQFIAQQAQLHQHFMALQQRLAHGAGAAPAAEARLAVNAPATLPAAAMAVTERAAPARPAAAAPRVAPVPAPAPAPSAPPRLAPVTPMPTPRPQPAAASAAPGQPARGGRPLPKGPRLDRQQLETHASGRISAIFGELFAQQDGYQRQVRMPEPPLLLADRVTGIDAEPGVLGTGTLWTETDVRADSWYLNRGRMPAGILIESGQADLMLISYMGIDFLNRSDRVYRLLGCELTFQDDLPRAGDTLCYDIHVDGHARQDAVRLFFFHYDCVVDGRPRIQVRHGQAGFFSDEELANSAGILWSPEDAKPCASPRLDPPQAACQHRRFSAAQVQAFADGRPYECFGAGFEYTLPHTDSPAVQSGRMLFLGEVSDFDSAGGPWGRGYLRSRVELDGSEWYFDGHFKNDPCMPGTLMFEGCLQALSFYIAALGYTIERDGWRFQPVRNEAFDLRCRGQVTPDSRELIYEVFVEEVVAGPIPTVYADLLCTVDGRKAFHARRVGLELVPDWPLEHQPLLEGHVETKAVASVPTPDGGRFEFGYPSLLACAWGRPSAAFGPMYGPFDGPRRVPRLPGPPYHFLSRVTRTSGRIGGMEVGSTVEVEYDIPPDAWYFDDNGARTMPYAVLLEAALQPCGWLASYIGSALTVKDELCFRNLDGTGTLEGELFDDAGTLVTRVTLTNISQSAGMIIVNFEVGCFLGERRVYDMTTVFGFFPPVALANQLGLPTRDADRRWLTEPSDYHADLSAPGTTCFTQAPAIGSAKLRMLHRITGYWPAAGAKGLGAIRAERDIAPDDWYFKAHFFQDPVQPGSLGIEAMIQLLQYAMLARGMHEGIEQPYFEPIALDRPMTWKYRGQVVPKNRLVQVTMEITEVGGDERGPFAIASASLWVDGMRIYCADTMGMRIASGTPPHSRGRQPGPGERTLAAPGAASREVAPGGATTCRLDPAVDRWLADHCPTWNRPALPMMSIVDLLADAVPGRVIGVRDVQLKAWLDFDGPRQLRTVPEHSAAGQFRVRLFAADSDGAALEIASGVVLTGDYPPRPEPLPALAGAAMADPYACGRLFHGPAFQLWTAGVQGSEGASTEVDAGFAPATGSAVPRGRLHPALLDASLHGIPHDELWRWSQRIPRDVVGYPARVTELNVYGPTPGTGTLRCEVRFDGFLAAPNLPRFKVQIIGPDGVWLDYRLVESCFPKGALGAAEPQARRAFLRDHRFQPGVALARMQAGRTRLNQTEVDACDWMPGTIAGIYHTTDLETIAVKEHIAAREQVHPSLVPDGLPLTAPNVTIGHDGGDVVVADRPAVGVGHTLALGAVHAWWNALLGIDHHWLGQDLWEGLLQRYVSRVVLEDPQAFATLRGRGAIFVGNHQVQLESLLITNILSALLDKPVVTMANAKHQRRWIGWILGQLFSYPGCRRDPQSIVYFDQTSPTAMPGILDRLAGSLASGERAFFVHPQGTRSRSCREEVTTISSLFLDMAIKQQLPIVPVRFSGGLPVQPLAGKLEFPIGNTGQCYTIGRPIEPDALAALPYAERRTHVIQAINTLGPAASEEEPGAPDPVFSRAVERYCQETGANEVQATFMLTLMEVVNPCRETRMLIEGVNRGRLQVENSALGRWLGELARRLYGPRGAGLLVRGPGSAA